MEPSDKQTVEMHSADVVQKTADAAEAVERARVVQMHTVLTSALREVLADEGGSPLLIKRIPFICIDIKWIKMLLWVILSANGSVILLLIGLLIQRALT